ncbi:hypothetical protein GCM10027596_22240 [Nocardioides korecus]
MSPEDAARKLVVLGLDHQPCQVHLCNSYTFSLADGDDDLRDALVQADLNLPDGVPVAWLGRSSGVSAPVRGSKLFEDVVRQGVTVGARHYLYGGAEGVAPIVAAALQDRIPGAEVAGIETPPWTDLDETSLLELASRVIGSGATHVWVGLGTPRQDYLVHRLTPLIHIPVIPIGAAFDFWAGTVREAPPWMQGTGFEWIFRLRQEPRRLWRRYLVGNPRFVLSVVRHSRHQAARD